MNGTTPPRRYATVVVTTTLVALLFSGCGSKKTEAPTKSAPSALPSALASSIPAPGNGQQVSRTFVGAVTGTKALVAVVANAGKVIAYVCDGQNGDWGGGSLADDRFDVRGSDGTHVTGSIADSEVHGTVTLPDGTRHAFKATPAAHGLGLYREVKTVKGVKHVLGWIVGRGAFAGVDEGGGTKAGVATTQTSGGAGGGGSNVGGSGGTTSGGQTTLSCDDLQKQIDHILDLMEFHEERFRQGKIKDFQLASIMRRLNKELDALSGMGCE